MGKIRKVPEVGKVRYGWDCAGEVAWVHILGKIRLHRSPTNKKMARN